MSKRNPWAAFYWGDYVADTSHLSLMEHGAYVLLMAHYYNTAKPLPTNTAVLARICKASTDEEVTAFISVLNNFFKLDGDVYRHSRIDRELCIARSIQEASEKRNRSRSEALSPERRTAIAKAAAAARWGGSTQTKDLHNVDASYNASTDASGMLLDASQSQSQSQSHKERKNTNGVRLPEDFIPLPEHYALAIQLGLNCDMEYQRFRDYWLGATGSRARKCDWSATLRNWLRTAAERKPNVTRQASGTERVSTQVKRAYNNLEAIAGAFADVVGPGGADSAGQAPRPSRSNTPLLEAEVKKVQ